jgi:hypothetical protein
MSPASEPAESTSDESYQDSDVEEIDLMSPMMNQFQVQSLGSHHLLPYHMHNTQALQPFVMTFQLSETMLQPVEDPENRHLLRSLLDMNLVTDHHSEVTYPSSSPSPSSSSQNGFRDARLHGHGKGTWHHHDTERVVSSAGLCMQVASPQSNSPPLPSSRSPRSGFGFPRPPSSKQQKKSKTHLCEQCNKVFPRPSGLATHMNSHSGAKRMCLRYFPTLPC